MKRSNSDSEIKRRMDYINKTFSLSSQPDCFIEGLLTFNLILAVLCLIFPA